LIGNHFAVIGKRSGARQFDGAAEFRHRPQGRGDLPLQGLARRGAPVAPSVLTRSAGGTARKPQKFGYPGWQRTIRLTESSARSQCTNRMCIGIALVIEDGARDACLALVDTTAGRQIPGFGMDVSELADRPRRRELLARFARPGVWALSGIVPILFLARLFALTLYSIPESDDYCFSYLNATRGLAETVWIWYHSVVGRIVPLVLIQMPAAISGVTGIDYFMSYVTTLLGFEICFGAAIVLAAFRLWPRASLLQNLFIGAALAAVALSSLPSLREMLYWLPGVACYTLPGVIVLLVLVEFVRAAESGRRISPAVTGMLALGCFIAALCNEFTPAWLICLVLGSLIVRAILRHDDLQIREHAIVGAATLVGFVILLLAPGNTVRMGMFPMAGQVSRSVGEAFHYLVSDLQGFVAEPRTRAWLIVVMIFTVVQPRPARVAVWKRLLLAALVSMFCFACVYLAYFTAEYATGDNLPTRSQNETTILLVSGLTISAVLVARSLRGMVPRLFAAIPREWDSPAGTIIAIVLGAILISPLYKSRTMNLLRSEQKSFDVFWLESMDRHAYLTLSKEDNLVVTNRSVFPTALMAEEMTDNPYRLPNDCIARFYGKKTVVVKPQVKNATPADVPAPALN
jgi:hypothetical protein